MKMSLPTNQDDDDDVMITEITSAPAKTTVEQTTNPTCTRQLPSTASSNQVISRTVIPNRANAINVMTKMGLKSATNPYVLEALKTIQATKFKRGPKEKATFQRFIYCLPDQNAKIPRFSSSDEKSVIKSHQDQGYGFPPLDYNDGFPKRTCMELRLSSTEFDQYLKKTYPKLSNRFFDVYKIDKQRRLLKLEQCTPRSIKDSKYQGTIIIVPYDNIDERPADTLYKNSDQTLAFSMIKAREARQIHAYHTRPRETQSKAIVSLPNQVMITDVVTSSSTSVDSQQYTEAITSSNELKIEPDCHDEPTIIKIEEDYSEEDMEAVVSTTKIQQATPESDNGQEEADTSHPVSLKYFHGIFERTEYLRSQLKSNVFYIHIDEHALVNSMLQVYRDYLDILDHKVVVCCVNHHDNENERHQQNPIQPFYVKFWEDIFGLCFEGNKEMVPVCSTDIPEDIYPILGRILYHGLVLHNYWPVRLSQACTSVIMIGSASEKQLTESFQNYLSDNQCSILTFAKSEARSGAVDFSISTQRNICTALRTCGNTTKPEPRTFDNHLLKLAKFCFIQKPYWCLIKMKQGMETLQEEFLQNIEEKDVFMFYSALKPSAIALFDKIVYLFSSCEENPEIEVEEKRVKMYLENFVLRLDSTKLSKLLMHWNQSDCLNNTHVYVRFSRTSVSKRPIFDSAGYTMILSSVYASQEEFSLIMSQEL